MDEKLDKAIENVLAMIRPNCQPEDALKLSEAALKLSQAVLNLTQVRSIATKGAARKVAGA